MNETILHYSLIRFLPHIEAGEFVNVGVVAMSPDAKFFDFKIESKKIKRVTEFFPEIRKNAHIYRKGLQALVSRLEHTQQVQSSEFADFSNGFFQMLARPRETIFRFSEPRTLLTENPIEELEQLFSTYVERKFHSTPNGPEEKLRQRLHGWLKTANLSRYYKAEEIGTSEYVVRFPFVTNSQQENGALKAIKPLNLNQDKSGDILQHGDDWLARIRRLERMDTLPKQLLFAVKQPTAGTIEHQAAQEICQELSRLRGVTTLNFEDPNSILDWANISTPLGKMLK